jgi:GNAT superfamily N-acetyltransferase
VTKLSVRPARIGDGPGIARCWTDAGRHYIEVDPARYQVPEESGLPEWFEHSLTRAERDRTVLVAERDGVIAGFCAAHLERPSPEPWRQLQRDFARTRVVIDAIAVTEPLRRTGTGVALMAAAEAWARDNGAQVAFVDSFVAGPTAVPFYERKMGYERRSIRFEKQLS